MSKKYKPRKVREVAPAPPVERLLWDVRDTAASMGVKPFTVRSYVATGILKPVRLPSTSQRRGHDRRIKKLLFTPDSVRELIEKMQQRDMR